MAGAGEVISHWYHGVNNYNTSASDFYANVEEAVKRRGIPDVQFSRVDHAEGGVLSAKREYLRIARGRLAFDVCAAPFGKGYFFSWWLTRALAPWLAVLVLTLIADAIVGALIVKMLGFRGMVACALNSSPSCRSLWASRGPSAGEHEMSCSPFPGWGRCWRGSSAPIRTSRSTRR